MIATAVPAKRREVLAIDMCTVLRLPRPFVNPLAQLIDGSDLGQFAPVLVVRHLAADCLGIAPGNCSGDWPWARHVAVVD